jgi:RES domain-containing protein
VREAWRLVKKSRAAEAFSGEGARLFGGRWNRRGTPVVYLADSLALAALEIFAHLNGADRGLEFTAFRVELPARARLERLGVAALPAGWRAYPTLPACQELGSQWARAGAALGLWLPSALVPVQHNLLLNPAHKDFAALRIHAWGDFSFDPRMWK